MVAFCWGLLLPPHSSKRAWGLAARFLEFTSASRSEAEGWARPASPEGRSTLSEWGDWQSGLWVCPTGGCPPCLEQVSPCPFLPRGPHEV